MLTAGASSDFIWIFFFFQTSKLYSNSFLASLNGRGALLQNVRRGSTNSNVNTNSHQRSESIRWANRTNVEVRIDVDVDMENEPITPGRVHFLKSPMKLWMLRRSYMVYLV
ncbi:hypothetical protein K435DRAFT_187090 [Dendrothele bispora CBS 962.96]|uniref:DUF6534 domain-containing protein n=1 Tax=Dendrothele bispora (strain CBS 962.96) TaxID=1314807 RepID=A0A4S8MQC2_DENBC|nr:hypothetical protein K435DRAFT_187090 [Dendrothele bispora CBS 962.96]